MAHTHEFDCKVCGVHLDSRQELDRHNREKHPSVAKSGESSMRSSGGSDSNRSRDQR